MQRASSTAAGAAAEGPRPGRFLQDYKLREAQARRPGARTAHRRRSATCEKLEHDRGARLETRDRLSSAGHAGGDFQIGGAGGQPRRHIAALKRYDLIDVAIRAPEPGAPPFAYLCDDQEILGGLAPLRCATFGTSNGSRRNACCREATRRRPRRRVRARRRGGRRVSGRARAGRCRGGVNCGGIPAQVRLLRHRRELAEIVAGIGDLVGDDQVMLGVGTAAWTF